MTPRRAAVLLLCVAALAAAGLVALAVRDLKSAAAGWLVGFVFWSGPPLGSMVWMMIHRLTGGRWGFVLRPVFARVATLTPIMGLMLVPALIAMPVLYPWMHGESGVIPSVAHVYLNAPSFAARSVIAFVGWSVLALAVPRTPGPRGTLLAALGLVFYGVLISLVPVDWILALEHPFTSESFGASVAVTHLIAALAFAAVLAPPATRGVESDVGALLLAMVLSLTYLDFMAVLVIWYGDLPSKEFWFVERGKLPWSVLAGLAFVLACVLPILALLLARVRRDRVLLRSIGAIELLGLAVYDAYLILPPFGSVALIAAGLALVAVGALLGSVMLARPYAILLARRRFADGG